MIDGQGRVPAHGRIPRFSKVRQWAHELTLAAAAHTSQQFSARTTVCRWRSHRPEVAAVLCSGAKLPPAAAVLASFGLHGEPVPLTGGRGQSWLVGQAALKPLDMPLPLLQWQADLLTRLDSRDDLRVSVPLRTVDDEWTSHGWTAWRYQPGRHLHGHWLEVVDVGQRLHTALQGEPEPAFLAERTDVWAVADRVAWEESPAIGYAGTKHLDRLIQALRPVPGLAQLVHGDLTGNVLFHPHLPPLVIDLSPYWRPPAYASAVVIADALVFEAVGNDIVQPMLRDPAFPQYLLRALIFRAVTDHLARRHLQRPHTDDGYRLAVELAIHLTQRHR